MYDVWLDGRMFGCLFCLLVLQANLTNSRTSWRLNIDKVVKATDLVSTIEDDPIFDILASSINIGNGQGWSKTAASEKLDKVQVYCHECKSFGSGSQDRRFMSYTLTDAPNSTEPFPLSSQVSNEQVICTPDQQCEDVILDCGKPVNFTYYDNLIGVANRNKHPLVPEPNVALMFKKNNGKAIDVDIDLLEKRLKKAKREKPKSVQLYNQIGNFWRIKGDAQRSIECFRRALAVSPHNAEVLLNLARVLLVLQYLDDATYLARRSLELQPPDRNAWEQYLTLGQIFKAYGHFQEAAVHLRHALELKPDLSDAAEALKEVESLPAASIHIYTLLIIICLVLGVLLVVLSSVECDEDSTLVTGQLQRPVQRHFSRAMAMRSLRLNVARNKRC
ncbi:probable UDP-N-acetylglucosamine--peptide N-acetylglucosaminyltransferase SEC [Vespa crabro]|uniref:probable UDP-N-acetylglucosamine--peptide N-acetylglucosaminyltransferase SEC n=1 Tax=Vespa crabro TaxID=7445 RepID=UPI001F0161D5|nr:probable UDP-N-acetylglucosamine--peptide N-acetylglucosaminyltransferase SEC [Vespa crabro]